MTLNYHSAREVVNVALANCKEISDRLQSELADMLLQRLEGGFFMEAGAFDGEQWSNSLFLEQARNWTGLLVESVVLPHHPQVLRRTLNAVTKMK